MKTMLVLGIMSGTSLDGVDYALCRIKPNQCELVDYWKAAFGKDLRHRLSAAARNEASSYEVGQLHHDLGRFYAQHARDSRGKPDLVGLHGQTIFHSPSRRNPATFQIGEPAYLVEQLRVPVVSNFRAADLAAGGEGAPLATIFHVQVFAEQGKHVCVNNLGGISNVTSIDWRDRQRQPRVRAFDTGPGNMLIDLAIRRLSGGKEGLDRNGAWAKRGKPNDKLLSTWLKNRFFLASPPKSTGREMFGEKFIETAFDQMKRLRLSRFDIVATLTAFTARSIALNYRLHLKRLPDTVVLTGGGAANPVLVDGIKRQITRLHPFLAVHDSRAYGWPRQTVEAAAFALLAYLQEHRLAGNLPETTGARHGAILGQVSWPPS